MRISFRNPGSRARSPCARHLKPHCLIWSLKQPSRRLEFVLPILQTRKQGWRDRVFCPKPREQEAVRSLGCPVHRPFPSFPHQRACLLTAPQPQEPSSIPLPVRQAWCRLTAAYTFSHLITITLQPRCSYHLTRELRLGKGRWRVPRSHTERRQVQSLNVGHLSPQAVGPPGTQLLIQPTSAPYLPSGHAVTSRLHPPTLGRGPPTLGRHGECYRVRQWARDSEGRALSPASSHLQIGGVPEGRISQSCKFWLGRQPFCASRGLGHMPGKSSGPGWFLLQPQAGTMRRVGPELKWAYLHTPDARAWLRWDSPVQFPVFPPFTSRRCTQLTHVCAHIQVQVLLVSIAPSWRVLFPLFTHT